MAQQAVTGGGFSSARVWNNKEARFVIVQIVTVIPLFAFLAFIVTNATANLAAIGRSFSFDFLFSPASYDISQTLIPFTSRSTHWVSGTRGMSVDKGRAPRHSLIGIGQ